MKVLSIVNQKGGVGKSTIACNLAVHAALDKKKTLIIDGDPQGSSMAFRAIRDKDDIRAVSITQPTIHKDISEFGTFDLIIIDAGGRDNTLFRSAVTAASKGMLIIPILPSQYDIWAAEDTFKTLEEARVYVDIDTYAVFNQTIQNTTVAQEAREALGELTAESDIKILDTVLYSRVDYKKSIAQGLSVVEYQPKSKASEEIANLYSEIKEILDL